MILKWNAKFSTVEHIIDRMLGVYSTKVPVSKAMDLMCEPKASSKTWTEHFKYLVYVEERVVVDVVEVLGTDSVDVLGRDIQIRFVDRIEDGSADAGNDRTCWSCGGIGHLKHTFSADKVIDDAKVTLAIDTYCETLSTALKHGRQPKEARYVQRNEEQSSCALLWTVDSSSNIISYALLEKKGAYLTCHGSLSYVERAADENTSFGVRSEGRVRLVEAIGGCARRERVHAVLAEVPHWNEGAADAVTDCNLLELHDRLRTPIL
ncbi:hypothetical protein KXD40_004301 [Peronospora effusa]|uniref:Uncharacterized protein n=1 Tax=Peronospora effusa TaxID=542832 RepID=A0A3M6VK32_9STRA|nr:hypothetical protein DD238_004144 [Peronospora effusa]UIZ27888.1 hypothetical protein KXD40_004301 [Peronospora effusa]